MYKYLLIFTILFYSYSCNPKKEQQNEETNKSEKQKKVSKRDLSITPANSYSDLFMDSMELVKYLQKDSVSDSLSRRMISFYNTRNYQYAWFTSQGFTEQARGFWNLHQYSTTYGIDTTLKNKSLQQTMQGLISEDDFTVNEKNAKILNTELTLTRHFIAYLLNHYEEGFIKRKEMERFVPRKKEDPVYLADSLVSKKHKDDRYYEDVNPAFKALKEQLPLYINLAKNGGWPVVPASVTKYKTGDSAADIVLLKKRLFLSQDLSSADSSPVFNGALSAAINKFQVRHGYSAGGKLTTEQLKDMNVSASTRLAQILLNMGRMQWLINQPKGKLIVVNIPEFILRVKEEKETALQMNVVVGKEGHSTMIFTGNLNQIIFSPYWNVPPSIVTKEIMPAIEKNPGYLASQNMEIVNENGGVPAIRQLPGPKNALGRVKFLFPNSFDIYFHDTPSKSLFEKDKRAYSHGCIRLGEPEKLARYLLQGTKWTDSEIEDAMNSGVEQPVKLSNPVPVLITYYTAWTDEAGLLHFAGDIYGHDKSVADRMFTISY